MPRASRRDRRDRGLRGDLARHRPRHAMAQADVPYAASRRGRPCKEARVADAALPVGAQPDDREIHKVPDPFPLSLAGMIAMLGPQAINFGISVGGGEAYLLPNIAARGAFHMHWLMLISVVLEAALVYECIKYSMCTGRSFFAATNVLKPYGFWPWFWVVADDHHLRLAVVDGRRGGRGAAVHRHLDADDLSGLDPAVCRRSTSGPSWPWSRCWSSSISRTAPTPSSRSSSSSSCSATSSWSC